MSDDDKKATFQALLAEYEETNKACLDKKSELEQAMQTRSEVVKRIAHFAAPKKRILFKGAEYSVVERKGTFFLRGSAGGAFDGE